jgi:hypothetical protein
VRLVWSDRIRASRRETRQQSRSAP